MVMAYFRFQIANPFNLDIILEGKETDIDLLMADARTANIAICGGTPGAVFNIGNVLPKKWRKVEAIPAAAGKDQWWHIVRRGKGETCATCYTESLKTGCLCGEDNFPYTGRS
jgi:hypothetical protein